MHKQYTVLGLVKWLTKWLRGAAKDSGDCKGRVKTSPYNYTLDIKYSTQP